jgi:hypothetical protein
VLLKKDIRGFRTYALHKAKNMQTAMHMCAVRPGAGARGPDQGRTVQWKGCRKQNTAVGGSSRRWNIELISCQIQSQ